jgi:predicted O-methyltransferase YrrM
MSAFQSVTDTFGALKYMKESQAQVLRRLIETNDAADILELGFYSGKSSAYIAAILEDRGKGHLTTIDKVTARNKKPSIMDVLSTLGLSHRVTTVFAERSYTWELARMLQRSPQPRFDLAYLDGGHTWDMTGFGFFLVDRLLRPGGIIVFDDMNWTMERSRGADWSAYPEEERKAMGVRMVFELLVKPHGYIDLGENLECGWGIARKPPPGRVRAALLRLGRVLRRA